MSKTIRIPVTNAKPAVVAAILDAAKKGSFAWLDINLKGKVKGGVLYGNHRKRCCLVTGFLYVPLCERSLEALQTVDKDEVRAKGLARGYVLDDVTIAAAIKEVRESLEKSIAGENESTTDHVFETLHCDGQPVQGSRVYIGEPEDPTDPMAPTPFTIYLQGLLISDEILVPAPNGPIPPANSKPKTVAKNIIRNSLPVGRYRQYVLHSDQDYSLRIGGAPKVSASDGVTTIEVAA